MTTYILGAGPAGMAVVDGLVDANAGPFVMFERGAQLGGLAQTLCWENIGDHDLGPHKIFSTDKSLVSRVEALLPEDDWLTRDKVSSIYMKGHYLPYPPSPFSLAGVFGIRAFVKMVAGYGMAQISNLWRTSKPRTFEEDLERRLGKPLYNVLFKPIAEKLWGNPQKLDVKLSKGRVQTPSLIEVLGRLLKLKNHSEFEALTFRYPKGGLSRLWKAIEKKSVGHGEFRTGHTITGLDVENGRIEKIKYTANGVEGSISLKSDDYVVSTLPLTHCTRLLCQALPSHFAHLVKKVIVLNDLLLVFFHVNQKSLLNESWVFIPDEDIVFHRMSEQESFDPNMTPNGSIVCCEIMSSESRPLAEKSDGELTQLAEHGLAAMGYLDFSVLAKRVIRLPKSYPVFQTGFEAGLAELIHGLDNLTNFKSIGRQGAFNYIGTLDAMDIGYGFSSWLVNAHQDTWQVERKRTNHYAVLD